MFGMCEDMTLGSKDRLQICAIYELEKNNIYT